jgi:hypothetical protein
MAAGVITTGNFPKQLWPGLNKIWGDMYEKHTAEYVHLFDKSVSDKAYEEDSGISGFGLVPLKPEGSPIAFDDMQQTYISRYTITYIWMWVREAQRV